MKSKLLLYRLLREEFKKNRHYGMCHSIGNLFINDTITWAEYEKLKADMYKHKPEDTGAAYWWPFDFKGMQKRVSFIDWRIESLSSFESKRVPAVVRILIVLGIFAAALAAAVLL